MSPRGLAMVAVCGAVVGCSGGDGDRAGGRGPADRGGVAPRGGQALLDAQVSFARCMRRQGVDFPDPSPGRGFELDPGAAQVDRARVEAAERRCRRYSAAIADAAPQPTPEELEQDREATLRYARCMRKQGQDVPDPRVGAGRQGTSVSVPAGAKEDPAFRRAGRECGAILRRAGRR